VLLAEVLLQQTQAARVAERYPSLLERWPTPEALATTPGREVLIAWSGLGYNSRALRLRSCAEVLTTSHQGRVPDQLEALRNLPGVGPYTSRAVLAFAFGRDIGVYDTNVARVLARAIAGAPLRAREGQALADELVPRGRGWSYNQAILDLGATVCTARAPKCVACPLRARCAFLATGGEDPARRTAGTARPQGRFEGSNRQLRGRVVEHLRSGPATGAVLRRIAQVEDARLEVVLTQLAREGMVVRSGRSYRLP